MRNALVFAALVWLSLELVWCGRFEEAPGAALTDAAPDDGPAAPSTGGGLPGDAETEAAGKDDAGCPIGRGPPMARVTVPAGAFCIDTTEVTNGDYRKFLDALDGGSPAIQSAACAEHVGFGLHDLDGGAVSIGPALYPVVNVDWCEAFAFCAWASKRLCGGMGGGRASFENSTDVRGREWGVACSDDGNRTYPYGSTFQPGWCGDGNASPPRSVHSVRDFPMCKGGADPRVVDLSGNVDEWEDACEEPATGLTDPCLARGGSVNDGTDGPAFTCSASYQLRREDGTFDVGFRCCSD
jgi:formylglycine-generating enzyme required for sulfatase activity